MSLISISIDIADSTKIKKDIVDFCKEEDNISKSYSDFIKQIYDIEMRIYFQLVQNSVKIEKIFVVKTIGDEIWIVYDIEGININTVEYNTIVYKILSSLIAAIYAHNTITLSERMLTPIEIHNPMLHENIKFKYVEIIPKIYIDLVNRYEEVNSIRHEIFNRRYNELFPYKSPKDLGKDLQGEIKIRKDKYEIYTNRLNMGTYLGEAGNGKAKIQYRFDPIGYEVDLFFRCTKYAEPKKVAFGEQLFTGLCTDNTIEYNREGLIPKYCIIEDIQGSKKYHYYDCNYKTISSQELKGIGKDYKILYFQSEIFG